MHVAVNTRVLAFAMGGQQRVAQEIMRRLPHATALTPSRPLAGAAGHAWEQFVLPLRARGSVLWSPSATGPVLCRRQVVTIHDTAFFDCPEFFAPSFVSLYQKLIPLLARRAARVATVSEFSRRQLAHWTGLPADRITVVPNGISPAFQPQEKARLEAARARLGLPRRFLLVQATSDRRKNLSRTLDAWRMAAPELPEDLHLVVSGNLGRAHVFGDASGIDLSGPRIRALGYVEDEWMAPLMAAAEAFVFASLYEGFGLPPLEAMACGTPVITSEGTALGEVVGDAALLVDPKAAESIAGAMVAMAGDGALRSELARRGLRRAGRFTWDAAAESYMRLFEEVRREEGRSTGSEQGASMAAGAALPSPRNDR